MMLSAGVFSIECLGLWVSGLVFLSESGSGFWATLVSNNREGTEEMTKAVAKGYQGVVNGLGHGIAACLSGVV